MKKKKNGTFNYIDLAIIKNNPNLEFNINKNQCIEECLTVL